MTFLCKRKSDPLTLSTTEVHIQWQRNGTPIAEANNSTLNIRQEGNYDAQGIRKLGLRNGSQAGFICWKYDNPSEKPDLG